MQNKRHCVLSQMVITVNVDIKLINVKPNNAYKPFNKTCAAFRDDLTEA